VKEVEKIIFFLRQLIDQKLKPDIARCDDYLARVQNPETRNKLYLKKQELINIKDRAAICVDILSSKASFEVSEDYKVVKLL